MRKVSSKTVAIIGMIIDIGCLALLIAANVMIKVGGNRGTCFALFVFSVVGSTFSLIFYQIDAVISAIRIFKNIHPVFNTILVLVIVCIFPVWIIMGTISNLADMFILEMYRLLIFVLEAISIVKLAKLEREDAKKRKKAFPWFRR